MRWVVTVFYHARLIDIRWYNDERAAREFYAECLVRYNSEHEITIANQ